MAWFKASNVKVRGQLQVTGASTFTGAQTVTGLSSLNGGGTVPAGQTFGNSGGLNMKAGTVFMPGGVGTAGVGTADLQRLVLSFGGGSARLTGNVGGTVYIVSMIPQP